MSEKLSPERAIRLLRAKAAELEASVLAMNADRTRPATSREVSYLAADIALIATLLADHMERSPGPSGPELDEEWSDPLSDAIKKADELEQSFKEGFDEGRPPSEVR